MQGKIFPESINIYQDQARILFNYYRKAAEKIVKEEIELEEAIQVNKTGIAQAGRKKTMGIVLMILFAVAILAAFIITGMLVLLSILPLSLTGLVIYAQGNIEQKAAEQNLKKNGEAFAGIRRDYAVRKLGVAYVPVASNVPFEGKSFMVDYSGAIEDTHFAMSIVKKPGELLDSFMEFEGMLNNIPAVETAEIVEQIDTADYSTSIQNIPMYDYIGNIDRQIRKITYLLNDKNTISISLPVITPDSAKADFIREFATTDTEGSPVIPVFNISGFKEKIDNIYLLDEMKQNFEKSTNKNQMVYFRKLIKSLAESVQIISKAKISNSIKCSDYFGTIFSNVLKAGFNHYSPLLEAEEIERIREASFDYQESVDDYKPFALKSSSRVKYDLFATSWLAEDMSRTSMPFGMHQIQEEVLMPVIQNLMAENREERLKIYNNIKDQKLDYLNQWHRDTEDFYGRNRTEANDLINRMRESYADYMSSYNTYKALLKTQNTMKQSGSISDSEVEEQVNEAEVVAGFELQAVQCNKKQEEFSDFVDRLKEDIDLKASDFSHIEYYEASLRDNESRNIARSTDMLHELDIRRKKLITVSPYVAKYAKLPPEPKIERQMYDDFSIDLIDYAEQVVQKGDTEEK